MSALQDRGIVVDASRRGAWAWIGAVGVAVLLSACAGAPTMPGPAPSGPTAPPLPRNAEPPPPAVNLEGFPLAYRQGYADGCASAGGVVHKDGQRYAGDPNYRTGWQDGVALCRRK